MTPKLRLLPLLLALTVPATPSWGAALALRDTEGILHRPLDVGTDKAAVVIFISDDCPISNSYAPEINRLCAAYTAKKIAFYLVSVDTGVSTAAIRQHAQQYAFRCPDLLDPSHALVKQVGATVTPEAVVYGPGGKLLYKGRIDDKYADFGKVRYAATTHDLSSALAAIAAGKPVPRPLTKAVGCFI